VSTVFSTGGGEGIFHVSANFYSKNVTKSSYSAEIAMVLRNSANRWSAIAMVVGDSAISFRNIAMVVRKIAMSWRDIAIVLIKIAMPRRAIAMALKERAISPGK
jgi:hypothetical protein